MCRSERWRGWLQQCMCDLEGKGGLAMKVELCVEGRADGRVPESQGVR